MGDSFDDFEPVGQWYNAIPPDDRSSGCSSSASNELIDVERFRNLFDCVPVESLDELLSVSHSSGNAPAPAPPPPPPAPDGWAQRVRAALLDAESSEDHMNGILQNALKEEEAEGGLQGLDVEEEEAKQKKQPEKKRGKRIIEKLTRKRSPSSSTQRTTLAVKERQIRDLFSDCYGDDSYKSLERLKGLPAISLTSSGPDFAAWGAAADRTMLMSGAGKHKVHFELDHAIRQCSAYMLVHLYYWLVTRSRLVRSVYGVAVAGANCRDMMRGGGGRSSANKFAVVLLRLSLPRVIGGKLLLQQYKIADDGVGSLDDLWRFANSVCQKDPRQSAELGYGRDCPALLQMPFELLEKSRVAAPETIGWHMVKNGTANLILRFDTREGYNFIKRYARDNLQLWEDEWDDELGELTYPIFFKSKNYLATNNPTNLDFYLIWLRRKKNGSGLYILMTDMGEPFHKCHSFRDLHSLAAKFHPFMKRVLGCQEASKLVHGDIHTGNLVYDGEILRLIDYDEARCCVVTARQPRTPHQRRVYNRRLARDVDRFTKNQLINLFRDCWVRVGDTGASDSIAGLMEEYYTAFEEGGSPGADLVDDIYDRLFAALGIILSETTTPVSP